MLTGFLLALSGLSARKLPRKTAFPALFPNRSFTRTMLALLEAPYRSVLLKIKLIVVRLKYLKD